MKMILIIFLVSSVKEKISNKMMYWSSEYIHKLSSYEFFKF